MAETPRFTGRYKAGDAPPLHLAGEADAWRLGDFKVVRLLGEGAMGKVYEAIQESLQRRVALKVLPDDFHDDADAVERFEREARACGSLVHPHIVPIYQFGIDQGRHYYAMEYVKGRSLRDLIKDPRTPLAEKTIAKYALHAAFALDHAHKQGVIHRDVKPDNILIREDDQACLSDFGLARKRDAKAITQAGALMGTPTYMAPEQAMGQPIDHRIDIYALGVTIWECLAGKLPFYSNSLRELLVQITQLPAPNLRDLRPDVSPDLEAIALKCMAKNRQERYATAKEVTEDIIRYFRGDVALARRAGRLQLALRQVKKHPAVAALAALVVIVLVSTVGGGRLLRRLKAQASAEKLTTEARALVEAPLARYVAATSELVAARAARDGDPKPEADAPARAALAGLRGAEHELLDGTADADAPSGRALELLREAILIAPPDDPAGERARELARTLVLAQRARAERDGDRALAASGLRELQALGALFVERAAHPRRLGIETEPPGARVVLRPVLQDERGDVSLGPVRDLGPSPAGDSVAAGEWVIDVDLGGCVPVRVPLIVPEADPGRTGADPGITLHVTLPAAEGVPDGFVYVPPGELQAGGDPDAVRPLFARREPAWTAGFFIGAREVTVAEYLEFLNQLAPEAQGPHLSATFQFDATAGRLAPREGSADQPVVGVSVVSARAYCEFLRRRHPGCRFRLPSDLEWEKAARGPFGRSFPWGDRFDPAAARLHVGERDGRPALAAVGTCPKDRSIYGIFDLAGNACEWVEGRFEGDPRLGVLRGGSWARGPEVTRLCSREPIDPENTAEMLRVRDRVGFRVAFDR